MSESATSLRSLSAEDSDPHVRSQSVTAAQHSDALAELARLVGQQDPFRSPASAPAEIVPPAAPLASEADFSAFDARYRSGPAADVVEPDRAPEVGHGAVDDEPWERPRLRYPTISVRDHRPPEPSPDAWAQGLGDDQDDADVLAAPVASDDTGRQDPGGARRTLIVLAAVIVLTGGGLAASFLTRSSGAVGASLSAGSSPPTIMAASGPSKVQPETSATGADAPSEPSTLLDKNSNDGTAAAKVVNTVEQPLDLAQAIKPAASDAASAAPAAADPAPITDPAPSGPAGAFPEPRKVKTVLVRPDGSIISETAAVPAADTGIAAGADQSSLAFDPRTSLPVVASAPTAGSVPAADPSSVMPKPAAPAGKAGGRASAPKPAASTAQSASPQVSTRTSVATPVAKPVAHGPVKPKPKPAAVADATPTATTPAETAPAAAPASGGTFSVQLGAAPSEADGHSAATRLAQKYDLGGAQPAVMKAEAGGKTIYRIRVGHLSQDEAKALCAKVSAGGGGCFITH